MWLICNGFSKYEVNENGDIRNRNTGNVIAKAVDRSGYLTSRLYNDDSVQCTVYVHRIVLSTFQPREDDSQWVVNHKNGIKTDPRLCNLEWTSFIENIHHAGINGLSSKCRPVEIRHTQTGNSLFFNSAVDCSRYLGESKDTTLYRLNTESPGIVWNNGYQYGWWSNESVDWVEPQAVRNEGKNRGIQIKDCLTEEVLNFDSQMEAASYLGIAQSTFSIRLKAGPDTLYRNRFKIRQFSFSPWI